MMRRNRRVTKRAIYINLTPLIDVLFLLIIFFVTSSTFQREFLLKVKLPNVKTGGGMQKLENQVILVKSNHEIFIENEQTTFDDIKNKIKGLIDPEKIVELRVDNDVAYGDAVKIMNEIKNAGYSDIGLVVVKDS